MSNNEPAVSPKTGAYIRQLRLSRRRYQDDLANILGVTKSLISHVETGRRRPSADLLSRLFTSDDVSLTLLEREELIRRCHEELVPLPPDHAAAIPAREEAKVQRMFQLVHVVANPPLELSKLNSENPFVEDLLEELRYEGDKWEPRQKYIFWTVEEQKSAFEGFLNYLVLNPIQPLDARVVLNVFEFIAAPPELTLQSFALYQNSEREEEYSLVGRVIARQKPDDFAAPVRLMGTYELGRTWNFLRQKYDTIRWSPIPTKDYTMYLPELISGQGFRLKPIAEVLNKASVAAQSSSA